MARMARQLGFFIAAAWLMLASSSAVAGITATLTFAKTFGATNIDINGSTSLTFTLTGGGGGATGAFGFTDTLPSGLEVSTPSGLSSISCTGGTAAGTATATAGSGSISLAGMNLNSGVRCEFSVNVTGTSLGTKSNSATTSVPGNVGSTRTAIASLTVGPTQPIPNRAPAPPTPGIGTQPTTLNLSLGQGPDMMVCFMNAVRGQDAGFGQAVYLGQDQYGVASIDLKDGRYLSFYPLAASLNNTRPPGLYFSNSNVVGVATSCGSFNIAPAFYNLAALGTVANALDPNQMINIDSEGVITEVRPATNVTYVFRPDFYVKLNQPAVAGLVPSSVARALFNDGAGNAQLIQAAFLDPAALSLVAAQEGFNGSLSMTASGTLVFTQLSGKRFLLTPLVDLAQVPSAYADKLLFSLGGLYWYRSSIQLPLAQRFSVTSLD
ncbi:MAG: hypothetical protein V4858_17565 [Pseudomonadota bacterium]